MASKPNGKKTSNRKCLICGQPSFFNYYKVQCCEGCKQFFRRVLIKRETYFCAKSNMCEIKQGTKCQSCRLDRCLLSGMDPKKTAVSYSLEEQAQFLSQLEERKLSAEQHPMASKPSTSAPNQSQQQQVDSFTEKFQQNVLPDRNETAESRGSFLCTQQQSNSLSILRGEQFTEMCGTLTFLANAERQLQYSVDQSMAYNYAFLVNADSLSTVLEQGIQSLINAIPANGESSALLDTRTIRPHFLVRYAVKAIEQLRAMPVSVQLDPADKVRLVCFVGMACLEFEVRHESVMRNSTVFEWPNGTPLHCYTNIPMFASNKVVQQYAEQLFVQSMKEFTRVAMCPEEFRLLLAIIMSHSATDGLSEHGRLLLQAEMERYARCLMQYVRLKYGDPGGVKRYAELLNLTNAAFMVAHKTREFFSYLDCVVDQGILRSTLPKILQAMCFHGTNE